MQKVFKRYEKKYLITSEQAKALQTLFLSHMTVGDYDTYWVQNLYFDTANWDVIHRSMQQPYYKEKMRLRYYGTMDMQNPIFLELKKKYAGIVYKRRLALPLHAKEQGLVQALNEEGSQIARELHFHLKSKQVKEKMFISCKRRAYKGKEDTDLRITLDSEIRYRADNLHFGDPQDGKLVLEDDLQVMEIKTHTSIPLWLSRYCSENNIFASPFSKYARCYTDYCLQENTKKVVHAHA